MPRHRLTNIDIEAQTATCSVCGATEIYVIRSRADPHHVARVYCRTRLRQTNKTHYRHQRKKAGLPTPEEKPRHSLSEIDPVALTAVCSVCGSTDIRKKGPFYICARKKRAYKREYRLSRYVAKPRRPRQSGHSLSQIDDANKTAVCQQCGPVRIYVSHPGGLTIRRCIKAHSTYKEQLHQKNKQIIEEYKVQHGCQRCGSSASPDELYLHKRNPGEKDLSVASASNFGRKRLARELEECDVLCAVCHRLVHQESA